MLFSKKTLEEQIARFQQMDHAWLEPMKQWIIEAAFAANIVSGKDLNEKKMLTQRIFGSNIILSDQKARGEEINQWAALRAAPPTRGLELGSVLRSNLFGHDDYIKAYLQQNPYLPLISQIKIFLRYYITPELIMQLTALENCIKTVRFYLFLEIFGKSRKPNNF